MTTIAGPALVWVQIFSSINAIAIDIIILIDLLMHSTHPLQQPCNFLTIITPMFFPPPASDSSLTPLQIGPT